MIPQEEFVASGPFACPRVLPFSGDALGFSSLSPPLLSPIINASFEGIHLEERPVKTTLNNLQGVDSFTRNHWHSRCVFRIDVGPPVKQGIEAVCVSPSLQVEHVEHTSGEHSPP
jgi:hypothetical protein